MSQNYAMATSINLITDKWRMLHFLSQYHMQHWPFGKCDNDSEFDMNVWQTDPITVTLTLAIYHFHSNNILHNS